MTTARLPVWRHMPRRHLKRMLLNIDEREFLSLAEGAARVFRRSRRASACGNGQASATN